MAPKPIHPPPRAMSAAPATTVGGVLAGPIVASYTRPMGYISTAAAAHAAPASFGSAPERQTATPRSTLPANTSTTISSEVNASIVSAKMLGNSRNPSMPARYACPSSGAANAEIPIPGRKRALPKRAMTMATRPMRPARLAER